MKPTTMLNLAVLALTLLCLASCRQTGRDKWEFNLIGSALYEDIAPLSSMGKKVYLCRIRASGQLAVESPGAVIPLPDLVEPRVTQIFHESGVDYAIIQGKDAAGGPMCALVTAPGGQANVFFLKNCREEDIQVRYTSKYIELVQPESNPKFWWRIENHDKVQLMEK